MLANERRNKRRACSDLLGNVKGIVFMGTPHRGSATASLGSMGAEMLKAATLGTSTNTTLIKQLKESSKMLQDISNAFTFLGADFPIQTFYETEIMDWLTEVVSRQSRNNRAAVALIVRMNRSLPKIQRGLIYLTRMSFLLMGITQTYVNFPGRLRITGSLLG